MASKLDTKTGVQSGVVHIATNNVSGQISMNYNGNSYNINYYSASESGVVLYQIYDQNGVEVTARNYLRKVNSLPSNVSIPEFNSLVFGGMILTIAASAVIYSVIA